MVLVLNQQSSYPVDKKLVQGFVARFLKILDLTEWTLSVVFVDPESMARYNQTYRKKVGPTDVISFPFLIDLLPGQTPQAKPEEPMDLGDILVCPDKIHQSAKELGVEFNVRLERMIAHSLVHLLGYDHQTDEQYAEMRVVEEKILGYSTEAESD